MYGITCLMAEEQEKGLFFDYVGQCLWDMDDIMRKVLNVENKMPQWVEIVHPELKSDGQTAEEVVNHVLKLLEG